MTESLEVLSSLGELYRSRGDEVVAARPLMTGDVLGGVAIPGLPDDPGLAIVLTHPCAMRIDGVRLTDRLLMGAVRPSDPIPLDKWTGHYRVMPLPELVADAADGGNYATHFTDIGLVESASLDMSARIACLEEKGVNVLHQRFVHHLTRYPPPTWKLAEMSGAVFEEVDIIEEWAVTVGEAGGSTVDAVMAAHDWLREKDTSGRRRQDQLRDPQRRAAIRRDARKACTESLAEHRTRT